MFLHQLHAVMQGESEAEDGDRFVKTLLPEFVERCMRCKTTGSATPDRVNEFFRRLLPVCVVMVVAKTSKRQ